MAQAFIDQAYKCGHCEDEFFHTIQAYRTHHNRVHGNGMETTAAPTFDMKLKLCMRCVSRVHYIKRSASVSCNKIILSMCDVCDNRHDLTRAPK